MIFKSGYVAILGQPNVGKSTLLNRIIGEPVAIVTPKPQTTRQRIIGILNRPESQIVFIDTPGYHSLPKLLNQFMLNEIEQTIQDCDLFCCLCDPDSDFPEQDDELMDRVKGKNPLVVVNKADTISTAQRETLAEEYRRRWDLKELVFISAKLGEGVEELVQTFCDRLPEGPAYFAQDIYTEMPLKFLAAEAIREQGMLLLRQEIPYGLAVEILDFEEKPQITVIKADLIVEKTSHKSMVIGQKGHMIKQLGTRAREKIELLMEGRKVFLDLRVRVEPDWTRSAEKLKQFGYG